MAADRVQIWLKEVTGSAKLRQSLRLPVVPEKITLSSANDVKRLTLCEFGEVVIPGKRLLRSLSLSSYFPARWDTNSAYRSIPRPREAAKLMRGWCEAGTEVRLIITGGGVRVNMLVLVEKFDTSMGNPSDDVSYELTLTEYRTLSVKPYKGATLPNGHVASKVTVNPPPPQLPAETRTVAGYTPPAKPLTPKDLIQAALRVTAPHTLPGERTAVLE